MREPGRRNWVTSPDGSGSMAFMVFDSEDAAREVEGRTKVGETPPGSPEVYKVGAVVVGEMTGSL